MNVEIGADLSGLKAAIKDISQESNKLYRELRQVNQQLRFEPKDTILLTQKQKLLTDQIELTRKKVDALKLAQDKANEALAKGEISEKQHRELQRELVKSESQLRNYERQLREVNIQNDAFKQRLDGISKNLSGMGENLSSVGEKLSKTLTLPLTALGGIVGKIGIDIQKHMSDIARQTGATGKELENLKSSFEVIGKTAPDGLGSVAQATAIWYRELKTVGEELEDIVSLSLDFARVNKTETEATTRNLTRLMNALEVSIEDLPAVMDKLTVASQLSGLGVNELMGYVIEAGPAFEEMGFGLDKSIGLFAEFYRAGANPRELLSSLNIVLNRMAKDGAVNAEQAFEILLARIKQAPDILSATTIASEAFGARVGAKVAEDIRAGRFEVDEWVEALQKSEGVVKATAEETKTFGERLAEIRNRVALAAAPIGEELINALDGLVDKLEPVIVSIEKLIKWFRDLSPTVKSLIVVLAGLGPALIVVGKIVTAVGGLMATLSKLVTFIKFTLIPAMAGISATTAVTVGIIAGLAVVAYEVYRAWEEVKVALQATWDVIKITVKQVVLSVILDFESMKLGIFEAVDAILEKLSVLKDVKFLGIGDMFTGLRDNVTDSVDKSKAKILELETQFGDTAVEMNRAILATKVAFSDLGAKISEDIELLINKIRGNKITVDDIIDEEIESDLEEVLEKINTTMVDYEPITEYSDERIKFEERWNRKLFEFTASRIDMIENEYEEALKLAEEYGADRTALEEYFHLVRQKIQDEEKQQEEERRKRFEQEWRQRVGEPIRSPREMLLELERERLLALEGARKLGADITDITRYYAERRLELELQIAQEQLGVWERIKQDLSDPLSDLSDSLLHASQDVMTFAAALFEGDIFKAIGVLLKESKMLEMVLNSLQTLLDPLIILLDIILLLSPALQGLQLVLGVIENLTGGLVQLWNSIIDALASIEIFGWKPFGHLEQHKREEPGGGTYIPPQKGGRQYAEISGPFRDTLTDLLAPLAQFGQIVSPIRDIAQHVASIDAKIPGGQMFAGVGSGGSVSNVSFTIQNLNVSGTAGTVREVGQLSLREIEKYMAEAIISQKRGFGIA